MDINPKALINSFFYLLFDILVARKDKVQTHYQFGFGDHNFTWSTLTNMAVKKQVYSTFGGGRLVSGLVWQENKQTFMAIYYVCKC